MKEAALHTKTDGTVFRRDTNNFNEGVLTHVDL